MTDEELALHIRTDHCLQLSRYTLAALKSMDRKTLEVVHENLQKGKVKYG